MQRKLRDLATLTSKAVGGLTLVGDDVSKKIIVYIEEPVCHVVRGVSIYEMARGRIGIAPFVRLLCEIGHNLSSNLYGPVIHRDRHALLRSSIDEDILLEVLSEVRDFFDGYIRPTITLTDYRRLIVNEDVMKSFWNRPTTIMADAALGNYNIALQTLNLYYAGPVPPDFGENQEFLRRDSHYTLKDYFVDKPLEVPVLLDSWEESSVAALNIEALWKRQRFSQG